MIFLTKRRDDEKDFLCIVLAFFGVSITSNAYPAVTVKVDGSS